MSATFESFVAVLKRSGLIDETALAQALSEFERSGSDKSAEALAQFLVHAKIVTEWQAGKLLQGKHKGFFLGKYKLLRLLGKGGMSSVYLAEHVLMKRRCAIKVLPWKFVKDSSYLQRFHREAQAVAALDHPNIVRAYDIDHEKDGNLEINFLVMEYVDGQNLYDVIQNEGVLSPVRAADFIRQGALGLEHAHRAGMVHRDVKPGNFILDRNGVVKLMDLGLARVHEEAEDRSLTIEHDERVLGTADYLAPEQAVDSHTVDTRADLYSLGCTLYYLLAGRPPFNEGTLTQRLLAHQTKEPPPIESQRDDVPESLLVILKRMMEKDRERRTQTAGEVAGLLTAWLAEHGGGEWRPPDLSVAQAAVASRNAELAANGSDKSYVAASTAVQERSEGQESALGDFLSSLDRSESLSDSTKTSRAADNSSIKTQPAPPKSAPRQPMPPKSGPKVPPAAKPLSSKKHLPVPPVSAAAEPLPAPASDVSTATQTESAITRGRRVRPRSLLTKKPGSVPLAVAGVAGAALIAVIAFFVFGRRGDAPPGPEPVAISTTPDETTPPRPAVDGPVVRVGPEGHFRTLDEAIKYVAGLALSGTGSPIQEIRIASGVKLSGHADIDNSGLGMFPTGLKIVGEGPVTPVLTAVEGSPAVSINAAEQLTLENLAVRGNGGRAAVEVRGYVVRTRLVNVRFEEIEGIGLQGHGVSGISGQQFTLENCRFQAKSPDAIGVHFTNTSLSDTRQVTVRECRFLGPLRAGVLFEGDSWDVDVRQCLFHDARQGIVFRGETQEIHGAQIANNTFHKFDRGVVFESGPSSRSERISLTQNLFVGGTGPEVWVAGETDPAAISRGAAPHRYNWSDRSAEETASALEIFVHDGRRGADVRFVSTDPGAEAFLKPTNDELRTAVTQPVGPLRFIGAVSP